MSLDRPIPQASSLFYTILLKTLLGLFCFRVVAQLVQAWYPVTFLPPFEAWESGAVPYWMLVLSQVLIVAVCGRTIWRLENELVIPSVKTGKVLLMLGSIYFGLMGIRLFIGLTVATTHFWFSARLPIVFHFVLAGFLMIYGWFHFTASKKVNSQSPGHAT